MSSSSSASGMAGKEMKVKPRASFVHNRNTRASTSHALVAKKSRKSFHKYLETEVNRLQLDKLCGGNKHVINLVVREERNSLQCCMQRVMWGGVEGKNSAAKCNELCGRGYDELCGGGGRSGRDATSWERDLQRVAFPHYRYSHIPTTSQHAGSSAEAAKCVLDYHRLHDMIFASLGSRLERHAFTPAETRDAVRKFKSEWDIEVSR